MLRQTPDRQSHYLTSLAQVLVPNLQGQFLLSAASSFSLYFVSQNDFLPAFSISEKDCSRRSCLRTKNQFGHILGRSFLYLRRGLQQRNVGLVKVDVHVNASVVAKLRNELILDISGKVLQFEYKPPMILNGVYLIFRSLL